MATLHNNIINLSTKSQVIGSRREDLQYLKLAREFNKYLKLDSTPILFALLKKGMQPKVSSIFAMSQETIKNKISKAVEQKIIPDSLDIELQLYLLNYKITTYIEKAIGDIFAGINDSELIGLSSEKKSNIVRKTIEYSYADKEIDDDFYNELNLSNNLFLKLNTFFNYRNLCYGNNIFINEFVESNSLKHIDNLLILTKTEIQEKISDNSVKADCLPDEIKKETNTNTAKSKYADYIHEQIEKWYQTRALFLKLSATEDKKITIFNNSEDINIFDIFKSKLVDKDNTVNNNSFFLDVEVNDKQFNIEKNIGRDFINSVSENNIFINNIKNDITGFTKSDFIRVLSSVQRLYYLTNKNKAETITALLKNNFRSAYDIVKVGKTNFINTIKADISIPLQRPYLYNAAELKVNRTLTLLSKYAGASNNLSPKVIKPKSLLDGDSPSITIKNIPELEELFGVQDVTDTDHGDSVLSSAAYLVDLLDLLKQVEINDAHKTLFDKLIERRPDIELIPLDNKNAQTLVPYIDLVIEILENRSAKHKFSTEMTENGTLWETWATVSNADELKAEPDRCAYKVYAEIAQNYSWKQAPFDLLNEEMRLYCQAMELDRAKWAKIISNENFIDPDLDVLNFSSNDQLLPDLASTNFQSKILKLFGTENNNGLNFSEICNNDNNNYQRKLYIKQFLIETGLSLKEFELLLDSYFINPEIISEGEQPVRISIHYKEKIQLKNAYLEFFDSQKTCTFIYYMYLFRRLQLALGWSISLLDSVLINITPIIDSKLITITQIKQLGEIKKIQSDYQLSNNQIAAIFGDLSAYEYKKEKSFSYKIFIDNNYPQKHKDTFIKILRGATSLDHSKQNIFQEDGSLHPFMKYICNTVQLSEEDVVNIRYLLETNSQKTEVISKKNIIFLIRYSYLRDVLKISAGELSALFKLTDRNLNISDIISFIEDIAIIKKHNINLEQMLYLLRGKKLTISTLPVKTDALTIIKNIFNIIQETNSKDENRDNSILYSKIISNLVPLQDIDENTATLVLNKSTASNNFLDDLINKAKNSIITISQYDEIVDLISQIPEDYTEEQKSEYNKKIIEDFEISEQIIKSIIAGEFNTAIGINDDLINNIIKIQEIFVLLKQINLSNNLIKSYLNANKTPIDIFNIDKSDSSNYSKLILFLHLLKLIPHLKDANTLFLFYNKIGNDEKNTASYFKWSKFISVPNVNIASELNKILWFEELGTLSDKEIGTLNVIECLKKEPTIEDINKIKSTAKNSLSSRTYQMRIAILRDNLRERQRDALVNYLIKNEKGLDDSNDLFSWLLIDTQMTSAVSTSRIVQATLAIQLLIQRIQFNLETDIRLLKSDENRWRWMSLYRVWEANRKIFLYPENWLEPELRDDKSPFYKELEKELNSNDITSQTVQNSYYEYIKKVEKIADIEYCQMFNETYDNYSVLHVVGRSHDLPQTYYYRKFINESYWTPWENLSIEIKTEHIAPVVIDDRLIIFWLEYHEEIREPKGIKAINTKADEQTAQIPDKIFSIQLYWIEQKNNQWSDKKLLPYRIELENKTTSINKKNLRLIIETGEQNYLYVLHSFSKKNQADDNTSNETTFSMEKPIGYKYRVQVFNNVELTEVYKSNNNNTFDNIYLPEGMVNYFQKAYDADGNVSIPISTQSGLPATKQIVSAESNVFIIYPHQYFNFQSQAPFILEKEKRSFIFVPEVQIKKNHDLSRQIRYQVENIANDFDNQLVNETIASLPEYYTDADTSLTLIDTNDGQVVYDTTGGGDPLHEAPKHKTKLSVHAGYHPYVPIMRRSIERFGIEGLLDPNGLITNRENTNLLLGKQANTNVISDWQFNKEILINNKLVLNEQNKFISKFEFNTKSPFGIYNWEMFFHIPFMVANNYYIEGNFDEALRWIHYIFDPREANNTDNNFSHFWKFKPFAEHNATKAIEDILFEANMNETSGVENNDLDDAIEIWSNDPFKPHNVARLRIGAYMKATVMRYLDIIVARGDQSFRVDTMEAINEALQYYIIAAQILGREPDVLKTSILKPKTYKDFNSGTMGNAVEYMEEAIIKPENAAYIEKFVESNELEIGSKPFSNDKNMKNMVHNLYAKLQENEKVFKLYFGIPKNDKMFAYWSLVGDRLFKIRNSMNIDGLYRTVSLFAPPIDPGMLAAATAAGLDIKALVNGQNGPETQYRFNILLNQALQLCAEIKSLGNQLISAYEKEDAEILSKLRAKHEILLSQNITRIREKAIEDADYQLEQLEKQKEIINFRKDFYDNRQQQSKKEKQQLLFLHAANILRMGSFSSNLLSSILSPIPDFYAGIAGVCCSPTFNTQYGGDKLSKTLGYVASSLDTMSAVSGNLASISGINAGYERRAEEWKFQADIANLEYAPLEKQKLATEIRKKMAEYELENHKQQLKFSNETYQLMQTKYSNEELYNWMRKEIAELQRKAYNMTYKIAKQAEKAYNFELNPDKNIKFISDSHFDTKYNSLFAGEKLFLEIKQMEVEYLKNNKRQYEITKQISLALIYPNAIINLRRKSTCEFSLPKILFDMDHPGHCNRRIKSVSLTIPCVAGPYTSISAELTLMGNTIHRNNKQSIQMPPITSMATSSAVNDSGIFQLNFNDDKYLPFEGAGVDSQWALNLPNAVRQFDYNTINDVIITIHYTAENGGNRTEVENNIINSINEHLTNEKGNFPIFIDVKSKFPETFNSLKTSNADIQLSRDMLPAFLQDKVVYIFKATAYEIQKDSSQEINSEINCSSAFPNTLTLNKFSNNIPENILLIVNLSLKKNN